MLRQISVNEQVFNDILINCKKHVKTVKDFHNYKEGYKNKKEIIYDGREYLICQQCILFGVINDYSKYDGDYWKQIIVRCNARQETSIEADITGRYAYNYINNLLKKYYKPKEIEARLNMFTAQYNFNEKQFHFYYQTQINDYLQFNNVVAYDINGAHTDALKQIFPLAAKEFDLMNKKKHDNPIFKQLPNYYVGYLARTNRDTYNWIVQRTTKMLKETIIKVDGVLLYANTDGLVVANPKNKIETSNKLGDFKLEFEGTAYIYQDRNYFAIQYGDKIKSNMPVALRKDFDLREGKVVHYERRQNEFGIYEYYNIKGETLNEESKKNLY